MINLYPYQSTAKTLLRDGFKNHQRQVYRLDTGGGKTILFTSIAIDAVGRGTRTLILTDRVELMKQAIKEMSANNLPICKIDADNRLIHSDALLFFGMIETVKRRKEKLKYINPDLIIIDEGHRGNFTEIFSIFPEAKVIAFTATPVGKHFHKYYTNLVETIDITQLIEQGYLVPNKGFAMVDDFSDIKIKKSGEFDESSQYTHYNKTKLYEGVIDKYLEKCLNKETGKHLRTLVFNVNVQHTENMTAAFNAAGIKSYCVTSKTPDKERDWILLEYERGNFPVLNNCGILTTGYNNPAIECIIMNRATMSLPLWLQCNGRGSRTYPGKKYFITIDFGGNFERLGMWQEKRTWSLGPPKKRKTSLGMAAVKSCKSCGAVVYASCRKCEYCGFIWEKTEAELLAGKLVEVTNEVRTGIEGRYVSQLSIQELIELEKTKVIKASYCWRILRARGAQAISDYSVLKGYKDGWIISQIQAMEEEQKITPDGRVQFMDKKINEVPLIMQEM